MASSDSQPAADEQLKESERKFQAVSLEPCLETYGSEDNPVIRGKVTPGFTAQSGNDDPAEDISDVAGDETTCVILHGQTIPESHLLGTKGDNCGLHVEDANSVGGTNIVNVEFTDNEQKNICGSNESLCPMLCKGQRGGSQNLGHEKFLLPDEDHEENMINIQDIPEGSACGKGSENDKMSRNNEKLQVEDSQRSMLNSRDEHAEKMVSMKVRTDEADCTENDSTWNFIIGKVDHVPKKQELMENEVTAESVSETSMYESINHDTNDVVTEAANSHAAQSVFINTESSDIVTQTSQDNCQVLGQTDLKTKLKSAEETGKNSISKEVTTHFNIMNGTDSAETKSTETVNIESAETSKEQDVRRKSCRNTFTAYSKKSVKIKSASLKKKGNSYNELLRRTREKNVEDVEMLEEVKSQCVGQSGKKDGQTPGEMDRCGGQRWRRTKTNEQNEEMLDESQGILADEDHVEQHQDFDYGSFDEVPEFSTDCSRKKKKWRGKKKNTTHEKEIPFDSSEHSFTQYTDEQDFQYSSRFVYYDVGKTSQDCVIQGYSNQYSESYEEEQGDQYYKNYIHQQRGQGQLRDSRRGNREFRRSEKSRESDMRDEGFSSHGMRSSRSFFSKAWTENDQMYADHGLLDRISDTSQHFSKLTITACGDGSRHVKASDIAGGCSDVINSVGSDTDKRKKRKTKNRKRQHHGKDVTRESGMGSYQRYLSLLQSGEDPADICYVEDSEYQANVEDNRDSTELSRNQVVRQGGRNKSRKKDKDTFGGEKRSEYTKLMEQSSKQNSKHGDNYGPEDFETRTHAVGEYDRPRKSTLYKKMKTNSSYKTDDGSYSYQEAGDQEDDVEVLTVHSKQGSNMTCRQMQPRPISNMSSEMTTRLTQKDIRQDTGTGDLSLPGHPKGNREKQQERLGKKTRHGSRDANVHMEKGAGDAHWRGRDRKSVTHEGGQVQSSRNQDPFNPNQRPHRLNQRQNHNPHSQSQAQQHFQGLCDHSKRGQQYTSDMGHVRRGRYGRRGDGGFKCDLPDQHQSLHEVADCSTRDRQPFYNECHRSGRGKRGQGGHRGIPQCDGQIKKPDDGHQSGDGKWNKKRHHGKVKEKYETYWSHEDVSAGLKKGTLIQGPIRINPRNYKEAYVPLPDGTADVFISGLINRNRALNGDTVAVQLMEREEWKVFVDDLENYEAKVNPKRSPVGSDDDSGPDVVIEEEVEVMSQDTRNGKDEERKKKKKQSTPLRSYTSVKDVLAGGSPIAKSLFQHGAEGTGDHGVKGVNVDVLLQKTGKVVALLEPKHSRACSGHLRLMMDNNQDFALFSPSDSRVPRIQIPLEDCPKDFFERADDYAKTLYIARIVKWDENSVFAKGHLARSLGEAGQIEPETEAMLIEHNVECDEFSEQVLQCLPQSLPWVIPDSEFSYRKDLRQQCIFTIDPSTARDLDDAMSIEFIEDDRYEVGVHIADVSFFLQENSALDVKAASRATSVYLVQKVIPMLPRLLCEELCSLNPDEDRLAFSIIWRMNGNGEVEEEWFGRTVIRSCAKLSYDHAQGFIEEPDRKWRAEELPPISTGFSVDDIQRRVLMLDKIAKCLRKKRFDSGALRLDQVKLSFSLDEETGMPNGYFVYEQKDSNRLIEEFMLLANMAVAHRIYDKYPEKAVLRRHPPPQNKMVDDLRDLCHQLGVTLDLSSSQTWQESLNSYSGTDDYSAARMQVLVALSSKPMQNAKYFCSGMIVDPEMYHHYALNVPLYTHFTSPIRRYADVMVHRLLAASLSYCELTSKDHRELHKQSEHCNEKKYMSKRVQELSSELFFAAFVREAGPFEEKAMVMGVMDHSFDVFILKFGVAKRVYCDQLDLKRKVYIRDHKKPQLTLVWKSDSVEEEVSQTITIFTLVTVYMKEDRDPLRWKALLKRPQSSS